MCILIDKSLRCVGAVVFYSKVFGLKMQKSTFFKKNGFESSLKNEVYVDTNWPTRLKKTLNN